MMHCEFSLTKLRNYLKCVHVNVDLHVLNLHCLPNIKKLLSSNSIHKSLYVY